MSETTHVSSVKTVLNHPVLRHFVVLHALSVAGLVVTAAGFVVLVAHWWASGVAFALVAWLALCAAVAAQVVTPWLPTVAGRAGAAFVLGWMVALMAAVSLCLAAAPGMVTALTMAPVWGGLWAAREVTGTLPALTRLSQDARQAVEHAQQGVTYAVVGKLLLALLAVSVLVAVGEPDTGAQTVHVVQVAGWVGLVVAAAQAAAVMAWRRAVPQVAQQVVAPQVQFDPWWQTKAWAPVGHMWRVVSPGEALGQVAVSALLAVVATVLPVVLVYRSGPTGVIAASLTVAVGMLLGRGIGDAQLLTDAPVLRWGSVAMGSVAGVGAVVMTGSARINLLCGALGVLLGFALTTGSTLVGNRFARAAMQRSFEVFSVALPAVAAGTAFVWASPPVYAASAMFAVIAVVALVLMTVPLWLPKFRRRRDHNSTGGVAQLQDLGAHAGPGDAQTSGEAHSESAEPDEDSQACAETADHKAVATDGAVAVSQPDVGALGALAAVRTGADRTTEPEYGRGRFIAVEGGDGAGKSTIVSALATALGERTEQRIVVTREPGGTAAGRRLRDLLLGNVSWVGRAEALMFAADRAQHVAAVIRPALAEEAIVISDRYMDSSIAYQSGGRELSAAEIETLSRWATDDLVPDVTVLLDLDPQTARERRQTDQNRGGPDRMEAECVQFHTRVREAFLAQAQADPQRYVVVDAGEPRPTVVREVVKQVLRQMGWDTEAFAATGEVPLVGGPSGGAVGGASSVTYGPGEVLSRSTSLDSQLLPTAHEVAEAAANVGRPEGALRPDNSSPQVAAVDGTDDTSITAGEPERGHMVGHDDVEVASSSGRPGSGGGRVLDALRGALPGRGGRRPEPSADQPSSTQPTTPVDVVSSDVDQPMRPDEASVRAWAAMVPSVVPATSGDCEAAQATSNSDDTAAPEHNVGAQDTQTVAEHTAEPRNSQHHNLGRGRVRQPLTEEEVAYGVPAEPTTEAGRFARGLIDREEALDPVGAAELGELGKYSPARKNPHADKTVVSKTSDRTLEGAESEWAEPAPPVRAADVAPTTGQLTAVAAAVPPAEPLPTPVAVHRLTPAAQPQPEPDQAFPLMDRTPPSAHRRSEQTPEDETVDVSVAGEPVSAGPAWGAPSTHLTSPEKPGAPGVDAGSPREEVSGVPGGGVGEAEGPNLPECQDATPGVLGEQSVTAQPGAASQLPMSMPVDRPDPAQRVDTGRLGHLAPPSMSTPDSASVRTSSAAPGAVESTVTAEPGAVHGQTGLAQTGQAGQEHADSGFPLAPSGSVVESKTAQPSQSQLPSRRQVHRTAPPQVVDVRDPMTPGQTTTADPGAPGGTWGQVTVGEPVVPENEKGATPAGELSPKPPQTEQETAAGQDYEDWFYEGEYGDEYRPR